MTPLDGADFSLDTGGVAGFFGGDEAISAMATVHIYEGRRWLGWYNSPGSYTVAKVYGRLARSRFWNGLFPGVAIDPAVLFELDGVDGPEYIATESGTIMKTGHVGHLFLKECQHVPSTKEWNGRVSSYVTVTVARLHHIPGADLDASLQQKWTSMIAILPILTSVGACVVCGVFGDWFCFSLILIGILSSGISCLVIGSGELRFVHPKPAAGAPKGDGILKSDAEVVVLIGREGAVNSVTRGAFSLQFYGGPEYRSIGLCALLLTFQFLMHLFLIPLASIFGQVLFLSTLGVSWAYNCYLSSLDREEIQRSILVDKMLKMDRSTLKRYPHGTRTAAVVFVLFTLRPRYAEKLLDNLIPNDTDTWKIWKRTVLNKVASESLGDQLSFQESDFGDLDGAERDLLKTLYQDAEDAYRGYRVSRHDISKSAETVFSSY